MRSKAAIAAHPIHPMLVSFPIALWITALVLDLIGISRNASTLWAAGFYCVIAGCVGAAMAAVPGTIDWLTVVPPQSSAKRRGLLHGSINVAALLLYIYIAYRQGSALSRPDGVTIFLLVAGAAMLGISGWLGGTLVYRNQIGVDHRYAGAGQSRERVLSGWERPVCNQSELADGQMLLAVVGKQRVVVGKCSQGLFAFADACTHRGGSLADGALVGCTVQCPWHGSQFDIQSGRVVAGPADQKIVVHPIEVRDGEVYVKLRPQAVQSKPKVA